MNKEEIKQRIDETTIYDVIDEINQNNDRKQKQEYAYLLEELGYEIRVCSECGDIITLGYCIDDTKYYCSDSCLYKNMTRSEYEELYHEDYAYWTQWL